MKLIDERLIGRIAEEAKKSPRLRMNYNFHENHEAPINRLLNVMNPGSYFPPHRHLNPDKQEIFLVLKGCLITFLFDDEGNILEKYEIAPEKGIYGMEIPPYVWHSFIVMESDTVVYEVKQGPFTPLSPENIASWAPSANDYNATVEYMEKLMNSQI